MPQTLLHSPAVITYRDILLTVLDAVDIGVKPVDGLHAVFEVAVAHVGVDGRVRLGYGCGKKERVRCPLEVLCVRKKIT